MSCGTCGVQASDTLQGDTGVPAGAPTTAQARCPQCQAFIAAAGAPCTNPRCPTHNPDQQHSRTADLRAALAPLAGLDIHHLAQQPDDYPVFAINETMLTVGDVRRAQAATTTVQMQAALAPLVGLYIHHRTQEADAAPLAAINDTELTVGDVRRAQVTYAGGPPVTPLGTGPSLTSLLAQEPLPPARVLAEAALAEPAASTRYWAAIALGELRDARAVPLLVQVAETDADPKTRVKALEALGRLGDPAGIAGLRVFLDHCQAAPHAGLRGEVIRVLGEIGTSAALAVLAAEGTAPQEEHRRDVVAALEQVGSPPAHDLLGPFLEDRSPVVRERALRALAKIGIPADTPVVVGALAAPDPLVQQAAAEALGYLGQRDRAAGAALVAAVSSPGPYGREVRRALVAALGQAAPPAAVTVLTGVLFDAAEHLPVREAAATALGAQGLAALPVLLDALRSLVPPSLRETALRALGDALTGQPFNNRDVARAYNVLQDVLWTATVAPPQRIAAAAAIAPLPAAGGVLAQVARGPADPEVRRAAVLALGQTGESTAVAPLKAVWAEAVRLGDTRRMGSPVAQALGGIRSPNAVRLLTGMLRHPAADVGLQETAVRSLGELAQPSAQRRPGTASQLPSAVAALHAALQHPQARVRQEAMRVLAHGGDPQSAATAILPLLQDADADVRQYAAHWLRFPGRQPDATVQALARVLSADDTPGVRAAAAFTLGYSRNGRAKPALAQGLHDPARQVQDAALVGLARLEALV